MNTVADLMERLYRTILEPPNMQPHMGFLASDISDTASAFTIDGFALPEDEEFLSVKPLVEIDSELMRVMEYSRDTNVATVQMVPTRNKNGTTAASHAAGTVIKIGTIFPRLSVFEAVADNIIQLYPQIYTVRNSLLTAIGPNVYPIEDPLAVMSISATPDAGYEGNLDIQGHIVDYHPLTGGRSFITNAAVGLSLWVRYRRRFGDAQTEADELDDLGLEPRWVTCVMMGAAADLLAGADVSSEHEDFISKQIEAETEPPGTSVSIAARLRQYRNVLLSEFGAEMDTEYQPSMEILDPFAQVTGGLV